MPGLRRPGSLFDPLRVAISLVAMAAILATTLAISPPALSAEDDLSVRLEAAFNASNVTVNEVRSGSAAVAGDCEVDFSYREWKGFARIKQASSSSAAQDMVVRGTGLKTVQINGVTGFGGTVNESDEYIGQVVFSSVNWARDDYFAETTLWGTTDTKALLTVAEVVDDVLSGATGGGSGDGSGTGDAVPPPVEAGLSASAVPPSFSKLGDSATVKVTLTGPDVAGKAVSLTGHGLDLSATTDAGGAASFAVTHDDEDLTEYRFAVTSEGMTREVVIPVSAFDIHPEKEAGSGQPYAGVVADGRSSLAIEIDLGAAATGTLRVATPDLGTLGGSAVGGDGAIALSGGKATVDYTPPAYLADARLTERIAPPEATGMTIGSARAAHTVYANNGSPWAAKVPLTFTHTAEDGRTIDVVVDVLVARAPVMLVHGFTGDKTTWTRLQAYLADHRFDPVVNEYYLGNQGVHDQARGLGEDIARELDRYTSLGLKIARVDIVGHSMGGLIARDYTWGFEPHPTDVRKIIMVGTPNHGANFFDKSLGNLAASWGGTHTLASEQLYSGSASLKDLNAGEAVGRHLNPDVQYGNIYGVLTDYVVPNTSAHLNGVMGRGIMGVTHSPAIPLPGVPITESGTVFGWVADWLGSDISRVRLRSTTIEIVKGEGRVYLSGIDAGKETTEEITSYPRTVEPWEEIGTGPDSRARIRLSVAGLTWGTIDLAPDSLIALGNVAPGAATVRVRRGSARFRSLSRNGGGHFQVVIGEQPPGEWYTFHPDAKVIGLDTDFAVSAGSGGEVEALVLDGRARFDDGTTAAEDDMLTLSEGQAGAVGVPAGYTSQLAQDQWWADGFYRPSFLEVLQEWWAIVRSNFQRQGGE